MDFFDLIKELRKGAPDATKAAKAMKVLGWICIFGAVWNYVIYYLAPFDKDPFNLPPDYPYIALIGLSLLSTLFFIAGRGIQAMEPWGKRAGQLGVVILAGVLIGSMFFMFSRKEFSFIREDVPLVFFIFSVVFTAQFGIPAFFGIRYLGRLPIKENSYAAPAYRPGTMPRAAEERVGRESSTLQQRYKESLFPFGVAGTFVLLLAVPMVFIMIAQKFAGPQMVPFLFLPAFLLIFFGPVLYNNVPSRFEKERKLIVSYTGGGSIILFNGTWPFFRLLVYPDGVELRVMFHRYFVPYDKMDDLPDKIGFFSRGILLKSNLPGVPSGIRFHGFRTKEVLEMVKEQKNRFMAEIK